MSAPVSAFKLVQTDLLLNPPGSRTSPRSGESIGVDPASIQEPRINFKLSRYLIKLISN
jgi:hypothetical protein